ncbi:DUF4145 domain-containing protein [Legionella feeleii]|uniref:DUF4145 domain-containing protein n=1 Tax=Legionella feeleii TaxID=453 RepID=A0A378IUU9_9GAMM|nr:DUF4145 domain-containing protein [Legionella feeleii]STX39008.1 Uncharacterised protein [Legionella feeleii]
MIDRSLWLNPIQENHFPNWICSHCTIGVYELMPEHFFYVENADTLAEKNKPYFGYEEVCYRFSAVLKCNNKKCNETAILTGTGGIDLCSWEDNNGSDSELITFFYPEYCCPPPLIFRIPEQAPKQIKHLLLSSFSIFFADPCNVANKLRCCLEEMLEVEKIPQTRKLYKLSSRLNLLCEKYSISSTDYLDAIRFIGDGGSHGGDAAIELRTSNILDAYELIEFLLEEIYFKKQRHEKLKNISSKYSQIKKIIDKNK